MKKKKPRAKSYQEIDRALDAALAKCGEPKLTFSKGISAGARAAEAAGKVKRGNTTSAI